MTMVLCVVIYRYFEITPWRFMFTTYISAIRGMARVSSSHLPPVLGPNLLLPAIAFCYYRSKKLLHTSECTQIWRKTSLLLRKCLFSKAVKIVLSLNSSYVISDELASLKPNTDSITGFICVTSIKKCYVWKYHIYAFRCRGGNVNLLETAWSVSWILSLFSLTPAIVLNK